jgi:transposase
LLWIGQHRRAKTLLRFFRWLGTERTAALAFICSDMWMAYLKVVAKKAGQALHILDRFHIAKHMSDAIDHVRRAEVCSLRQRGRQPLLTKARWGPPATQGESDARAARPLARARAAQPARGPRHAAAGMV